VTSAPGEVGTRRCLPQPNNRTTEKPAGKIRPPTKSAHTTSAPGEARRMRPSRNTGSPSTTTSKAAAHKRPYPNPIRPSPPSSSSAHDAREVRMAHGWTFRSRTKRPRKNQQQKHSTILTTITNNIPLHGIHKPAARRVSAAARRLRERFLWSFLFRQKERTKSHRADQARLTPHEAPCEHSPPKGG
jgi:hypothetical protein